MRIANAVVTLAALFAGSQVFAQTCCPSGCVQDGSRCVTTGPNPRSCTTVACGPQGGSGGPGGGGPKGGGGIVDAGSGGVRCFNATPTPKNIADATNRCMTALRSNAELLGCLFEDDAGKAEDTRTGLTCPRRQAALAEQCRSRCVAFATSTLTQWCDLEGFQDSAWKRFFEDIGGEKVGSARVSACGPALLSKAERLGKGVRNTPLIHK